MKTSCHLGRGSVLIHEASAEVYSILRLTWNGYDEAQRILVGKMMAREKGERCARKSDAKGWTKTTVVIEAIVRRCQWKTNIALHSVTKLRYEAWRSRAGITEGNKMFRRQPI